MEQNACSRSCGSSMSLMRTSVMSTAELLFNATPVLWPAGYDEHVSVTRCLQSGCQPHGLRAGTAQPEITRAASRHHVTGERLPRKRALQARYVGVQPFGRLLQSIVKLVRCRLKPAAGQARGQVPG